MAIKRHQLGLILFSILLFSKVVTGQMYQLEQRYVNMRERLMRDYLRIGLAERGFSIPMEKRVLHNQSGMICGTPDPTETAVIWDDNGLMAIGKYIAILCTEYELKRLSNEDTRSVLNELYFAIMAVKRLDSNSSTYHAVSISRSPSGHLLRDDVDANLLNGWIQYDNSVHFNAKAAASSLDAFGENVTMDPSIKCNDKIRDNENFMSKDEVIGLLNGFMYVAKFIPPVMVQPATYLPAKNLRQEVIGITTDIITYLSSAQQFNLPCADTSEIKVRKRNWVILNPHGLGTLDTSREKNPGSEWLKNFAWPIAKMGLYITGNHFYSNRRSSTTGCIGINDPVPNESFRVIETYNPFQQNMSWVNFAYRLNQNPSDLAAFLSATVRWLQPSSIENYRINANMMLLVTSALTTISTTEYEALANYYNLQHHILGRYVLLGLQPPSDMTTFTSMLMSSPECENIGLIYGSGYNTLHWGRYTIGPDHTKVGETNSMDFMLAYNNWRLLSHKPQLVNGQMILAYPGVEACDCHNLVNETRSGPLNVSNGTTKTIELRLPFYEEYNNYGIKISRYLNNNVEITNGSTLIVKDRLTHCTKFSDNQSYSTTNSGILLIGDGIKASEMIFRGNTALFNYGELEVKANSTLYVMKGAYLKNTSNIVVRSGAKLIVEYGATFVNESSNSTVEVEQGGELIINGAIHNTNGHTLKIIGKGEVIFSETAAAMFTHGNVEFGRLNNSERLGLTLKDKTSSHIWGDVSGSMANTIKLTNCDVKSSMNSSLRVYARVVAFNTDFKPIVQGSNWKGISVIGNYMHLFEYCTFTGARDGLDIIETSSSSRTTLRNCNFTNSHTSLVGLSGSGLDVLACSFSNGTNGILLRGTPSSVNVMNSSFNNFIGAISGHLINGQTLTVRNSNFDNTLRPYVLYNANETGNGIDLLEGNIDVKESNFTNMLHGISSSKGIVRVSCSNFNTGFVGIWGDLDQSHIYLSNNAKNQFTGLWTAIFSAQANISALNGMNAMDQVSHTLLGDVNPSCFNEISLSYGSEGNNPGTYSFSAIDFSGNRIKQPNLYPVTSNGLSTGSLMSYYQGSPYPLQTFKQLLSIDPISLLCRVDEVTPDIRPLYLYCTNCNFTYSACNTGSPPWYEEVYERLHANSPLSGIIVNTPYFNNVDLSDALRDALNDVTKVSDDVKNDLRAMNKLTQLLEYNYGNTDESLAQLLEIARSELSVALINAYVQDLIPKPSSNTPLSAAAQALINYYDDLITAGEDVPKLLLEKAQVYRLNGHYLEALNVLQEPQVVTVKNYDYWYCLTSLEYELSTNNINLDQFLDQVANCNSLFQLRKTRITESFYERTTKIESPLKCYPNPSNGIFTIELVNGANIKELNIMNALGNKVYVRNEVNIAALMLNLTFEKGFYTVQVVDESNNRHSSKLIIH
jgi:hypothetical protein